MTHEMTKNEVATIRALLKKTLPGGEVVLTENYSPVAKLSVIATREPKEKRRRKAGLAKGSILYMADDFDDYLELVPSSWVEKMLARK